MIPAIKVRLAFRKLSAPRKSINGITASPAITASTPGSVQSVKKLRTYRLNRRQVWHVVGRAIEGVDSHRPCRRDGCYCLWVAHEEASTHGRKPVIIAVGEDAYVTGFNRGAKEAVLFGSWVGISRKETATLNQCPVLSVNWGLHIERCNPRIQSLYSLQKLNFRNRYLINQEYETIRNYLNWNTSDALHRFSVNLQPVTFVISEFVICGCPTLRES